MDELRAATPLVHGDVTIVPVERCSLQSFAGDAGCWLSGRKEPYAVIVCDTGGVRAFDAGAHVIPLETLIRKIPDLHELLESIKGCRA
jgi:hypothetical protein